MKKIIVMLLLAVSINSFAQTPGEKLAATVLDIWKDTVPIGSNTKWSYDMGVVLKGFEGLWMNTGDVKYYNAILQKMDYFVKDDGIVILYVAGVHPQAFKTF